MRVLAIAVATLAVFWRAGALAAETDVIDLRIGAHADRTRVVLELSNHVDFRIFTLADPYRVVIDLSEVNWRSPRPSKRTGVIAGFRYGSFKPGTARIVLDADAPVAIKSAFLIPPDRQRNHRIVVDLVNTTRQKFLANLAAKRQPSAAQPALAGRRPLRLTRPSDPAARRPGPRVIAIDPGHGGVDPGTIGRGRSVEKHITLAMAREIRRRLEATGRYKVVLTREKDIFIRLRDRIEFARASGAELFISIHADAIKNRRIRGLSVYTLSEKASDREAAELADKENKADLIAGIDLTDESPEVTNILIDLAQRESMNQSAKFAVGLVAEFRAVTKLLRNTHRFAGFAVLKAPDVPSVLVELGFLSNAEDARALGQRQYRAKLASAVTRSVERYFAKVDKAKRL